MKKVSGILPGSVKNYLGKVRRRILTHPRRIQRDLRQYLNNSKLTSEQVELLRKINTKVHYDDEMYIGGGHYFMAGLSTIDCVEAVLAQTNQVSIQNILDIPCGYGRALRTLAAHFSQAELTACDIQTEAVDFVRKPLRQRPFIQMRTSQISLLPKSLI